MKLANRSDYEPFGSIPDAEDRPDTIALIEKVEPGSDGWAVSFDHGWTFHVPRLSEDQPEPAVGGRILTWGGVGYPVRGVEINGHVVYYRTREQQAERRARMAAKSDAENRQRYEENREDYDRRISQLPARFRKELEESIAKDETFRWKSMGLGYCLFIFEQAVVLADHFGDTAAIDAWDRINSKEHDPPYDYKAQMAACPGYSGDHSGWTHSAAVSYAKGLIEHPEWRSDAA